MENMFAWVYEFGQWLLDGIKLPFLELWTLILDGLAKVIEAIPVPDFASDIAGYASQVASGPAGWAWSLLGMGEGIAIIAGAYVVRFVIRRLPVVG